MNDVKANKYPSIEMQTRTHIDTDCASFYLGRKPQTLRTWAMADYKSPIKPIRINGRLAWSVSEIRTCLGL